jgi:hypothetical protein
MKKQMVILIYIATLLSGCEKNIDFKLDDAAKVLVVDAEIENGQPPVVVLSKSLEYFGKISPEILLNSFVKNAVVKINNGTVTHILKEYTVPLPGGYSFSYYSSDPASPTTAFVGEFNKKYTLDITTEGKNYTAVTNLPLLTKFPDSLWFKPQPLNPDTNARILMTRTKDPAGLGNYIRYFTKKDSEDFLPGENSVFDDNIIDGTTYEVNIEPGINRNNRIPSDSNYFKRGDTVTVKLCNTDKATYTFWNTWEFAQQSIGNPFSQPNKVIGNVSNGALGAFCGYAAFYKTVIAK